MIRGLALSVSTCTMSATAKLILAYFLLRVSIARLSPKDKDNSSPLILNRKDFISEVLRSDHLFVDKMNSLRTE